MAPAALGRLLSGDGSIRKGLSLRRKNAKAPRTLRPQDPTLPCPIAKISEDIILHIFELVHAASPHSAANLALVHPRFYRLARYVQHRCVDIALSTTDEAAAKRLDLIEKEGLLPAIQELRVRGGIRDLNQHCLSRLAAMLAGMTALRSVFWESGPIPTLALENLRKLPFPVQLHVRVEKIRGGNPAAAELLSALAGYDALTSVTLEAGYTNAGDCLHLTRPLKKLLLSCPNLVNLSIDLHLPRQGCVGYSPPDEYPGLGFSRGERPLRPLESLTIYEYPWGEGVVRGLPHSIGYPCEGREMDYWAANFDWSALRRLALIPPPTQIMLYNTSQPWIANTLAPRLTALREVSFTVVDDPFGNSVRTFFDQVPSTLEDISVPYLDSIGVACLARHAPTLRRLAVHQPGGPSSPSGWEEHLLSEAALEDLSQTVPHLEELGIDMLRVDGDWPRGKLDLLARFPRLRALELWFDLGNGPPQPALTASSAARLFADLRRTCPALQQLRIHSGFPPQPKLGFPASFGPSYTEYNSTSFTCRVAEGDGEAVAEGVAVTSPKLSPRLNARMCRILKGKEKREDIPEQLIALRVALDGPLPSADWERWAERWRWPSLDPPDSGKKRGRLSRLWQR
ncbi:21d9211f-c590-4420-ac64-12fd2e5d1df3 [Thermothielavioides terrestris]|jgi:hypothetical protein|uniref:Uncharacterized protein n=2 Tax=Thermothielavioides terrestris TaxID=2587410 RepID=G2RE81_THETT|nr:uncharacterized protein THITE_2122786 [Thermothielavioides terrestris NRRL 8126]AEO70910.1 hypothetical protein THITE_2122786 [Thermothielavioides terrestris NRRL 8126]SPQ25095.1 21d9211f-c590-4420-ac64-12fd2e5d1df3 [Thermothielavioides terrestris]